MEQAMEARSFQSNDWENRMKWKGTGICYKDLSLFIGEPIQVA
jgi:hypothetical protein